MAGETALDTSIAQCLENDWKLATDDSDFSYVDLLVVEHW